MELGYISLLALITMSVVTLVAISLAFYLYRWRRIILSNQALFVPEELISQIRSLRSEFAHVATSSAEASRKHSVELGKAHKSLASLGSEILGASATWQRALDERDAEVRKLRSGYDLEVFRRFIGRFARARLALDELQTVPPIEELDLLGRLLDDAFDECGVERFSPKQGEDYRLATGVDDTPKKIPSSNPDDAFRIVETITPGFRSRSTTVPTILIPARVSIYVFQGGN
jgi:hypothetical protein